MWLRAVACSLLATALLLAGGSPSQARPLV